jgi:hypothetical protein
VSGDSNRYSKVSRKMWGDSDFRSLSAPAACGQFLWLRLLTGPEQTTVPGMLFPIWDAGLARAIGWTSEALGVALRECSAKGMLRSDFDVGLVWLPNALKHNRPESPNHVRGWCKPWNEFPECPLKEEAFEHFKSYLEGLGEAYAKPFVEGCGSPTPSPADIRNKSKSKNKSVGKPPREVKPQRELTSCPSGTDGLREWLDGWALGSHESDPDFQQFLDHHRARGSRFKDWAATWRTWQRNIPRFGHAVRVEPKRPAVSEQQAFDVIAKLGGLKKDVVL